MYAALSLRVRLRGARAAAAGVRVPRGVTAAVAAAAAFRLPPSSCPALFFLDRRALPPPPLHPASPSEVGQVGWGQRMG